jgi:hypothetical protein
MVAMTDDLTAELRHLLESEKLAVLATEGPEGPHLSLIAFTPASDSGTFYFATDRRTRKYASLMNSDRLALLIDSRHRTGLDIAAGRAVTITGRGVEAAAGEAAEILDRHLDRHPYLEPFLSPDSSAFIRIEMEACSLVLGFSEVHELDRATGLWTRRSGSEDTPG